jgi:tellurite resistance protein
MSTQLANVQSPGTYTRSALNYLPVGLFGSVMGLASLSFAWHLASSRYALSPFIPQAIGIAAVATFFALTAAYLVKVVTSPAEVMAEFRHPIAGSLFGTVPLCLLQLPVIIAPFDLLAAQIMWLIGAAGMAAFAWLVVNRWMSDRQQVAHATPAWIIPICWFA